MFGAAGTTTGIPEGATGAITATIVITVDLTPTEALLTDEGLDKAQLALENLAAVMLVQAEDGLWALGSPDVDDPANAYVTGFESSSYGVRLD